MTVETARGTDRFVLTWGFVTIVREYVNMTDINIKEPSFMGASPEPPSTPAAAAPKWDLIELLFFAYRDFVGDPDHVLEKFGFGRAHHRVLHFVYRNPGLKVADLLDVLRITKQSLGRVLKQLIDEGYIVQRAGPNDRRQRLLYATSKGESLVLRLAGLQTARIGRALAALNPSDIATLRLFLRGMIDQDDGDPVLQAILQTPPVAEHEER